MDEQKAETTLKPEATAKSQLKPMGEYAQELRTRLPSEVFVANPARLVWFFGFIAVAVAALLTISLVDPIWPLKLLLGLVVGTCFGGLGFFGHELLHGSVVRNRKAQDFIGFFSYMPFLISPTFWKYWHNQLHHGKTQALVHDPDAFPLLKLFRHSKFMNFMFPFTPGSGHKRSYLYFFFWFSFHALVAQTYLRFRNSTFDRLDHRRATLEMGAQVIIWGGILYLLGPANLLWTFLIPLFAQNYFIMSYIATNHNLSPLTQVNDPLVNSLSVTNHPMLEFMHLNFGYHVEHHIFPTVSGRHGKRIHALLKEMYPNSYQYMPKGKAMKQLYTTARIYKNAKTLINPETGETYPTLSSERLH